MHFARNISSSVGAASAKWQVIIGTVIALIWPTAAHARARRICVKMVFTGRQSDQCLDAGCRCELRGATRTNTARRQLIACRREFSPHRQPAGHGETAVISRGDGAGRRSPTLN
ncbi:hypothetical protein EVAR_75970_1 [Eumeta japonica]|uniref:Uncharacterized protein n=1 Tax=Eumeta variegata TaxID=151549 RepID=A0A4C1UAZ1_EUMVA|nr:hypothetical protein EVAR_75970_1 [Eumeta japonica]